MNESWIWAAISLTSAGIGTALFIRSKLEEGSKRLSDHLVVDAQFHTSVVDRLARMETKIDILVDENEERRR